MKDNHFHKIPKVHHDLHRWLPLLSTMTQKNQNYTWNISFHDIWMEIYTEHLAALHAYLSNLSYMCHQLYYFRLLWNPTNLKYLICSKSQKQWIILHQEISSKLGRNVKLWLPSFSALVAAIVISVVIGIPNFVSSSSKKWMNIWNPYFD